MTQFRWLGYSIGLIFIVSGLLKSVNVYAFADTVAKFIDFLGWDLLRGWQLWLAVIICYGEILLGVITLRKGFYLVTGWAYGPVCLLFLVVMTMNYSEPLAHIESCGCFGELIHMSSLASFIKSAAVASLGIPMLIIAVTHFKDIILYRPSMFLPSELQEARDAMVTYLKQRVWIDIIGILCIPMFSLLFLHSLSPITYSVLFISLCIIILLTLLPIPKLWRMP